MNGTLVSESSDPSVVSVSNAALSAQGEGTATITVTYGGKVSDTVTITVSEAQIDEISSITDADQVKHIRGVVTYADSKEIVVDDGTGAILCYGGNATSTNFSVGDSVDVNGTSTVYHNGLQFSSPTISKIDALDIATTIGDPDELDPATVVEKYGSGATSLLKPVTLWGTAFYSGTYQALYVQDDESTFLIEPTGWEGEWEEGSMYEITGYLGAYYGSYRYAPIYITSLADHVIDMTSFTIDTAAGDATGYVDVDIQMVVTPTPSNANNTSVTWESSDETVATISSEGVLRGVKAGTVTITASHTPVAGGTAITASKEITITDMGAAITGITLDKTTVEGLHYGKTETLTANVTGGEDSYLGVTWTSSNESIATVDENGVVTGVATGTVTITATTVNFDSTGARLSASATVSVVSIYNSAEDPWTADEFGDYIDAEGGASTNLSYTDGNVYLTGIVTSYSWSTQYSNGSITLHSEKGYDIELYRFKWADGVAQPEGSLVGHTVTAYGNASSYNGTYELNSGCLVTSYSESPVTGYFTLDNDSVSVSAGSTANVVATYADTTTTTAFTAVSNDESIATVSVGELASGAATIAVTGVAAGETTITVSSGEDWYQTLDVTITAAGISTVEISTPSTSFTSADGIATLTSGDVTITIAKNSSSTAIRTSDTDHIRVYALYSITVSVASGNITKIEFATKGADYATALAGYAFDEGVTAVADGTVVTATLDGAGSVSCTNTATSSAQTRITGITVTYAAA